MKALKLAILIFIILLIMKLVIDSDGKADEPQITLNSESSNNNIRDLIILEGTD